MIWWICLFLQSFLRLSAVLTVVPKPDRNVLAFGNALCGIKCHGLQKVVSDMLGCSNQLFTKQNEDWVVVLIAARVMQYVSSGVEALPP